MRGGSLGETNWLPAEPDRVTTSQPDQNVSFIQRRSLMVASSS